MPNNPYIAEAERLAAIVRRRVETTSAAPISIVAAIGAASPPVVRQLALAMLGIAPNHPTEEPIPGLAPKDPPTMQPSSHELAAARRTAKLSAMAGRNAGLPSLIAADAVRDAGRFQNRLTTTSEAIDHFRERNREHKSGRGSRLEQRGIERHPAAAVAIAQAERLRRP